MLVQNGKNFIDDVSEYHTSDSIENMIEFLQERERNWHWFVDGFVHSDTIEFFPICKDAQKAEEEIEKLKSIENVMFVPDKEEYINSIFNEENYRCGSGQLIRIGNTIYPVGNSAIRGIISRAGLTQDGYGKLQKYNLQSLSEVLNTLFKATNKPAVILMQDRKIRAFHSERYAICPMSDVLLHTKNWIDTTMPNATFVEGYYNHNFCRIVISLSAYQKEILKSFPVLIRSGFSPALIITMSNTGSSCISLKSALEDKNNRCIFPLNSSLDIIHVGRCHFTAQERTEELKSKLQENYGKLFQNMKKGLDTIAKLQQITVTNAYNALLRGLKELRIPKEYGMESATVFKDIFETGESTAYDCFLAVTDCFLAFAKEYPNNYIKQYEMADIIARASEINWKRLGDIKGDFSW